MTHPGGSRNTPRSFMLQKPEISACLMGRLAGVQTLLTATLSLQSPCGVKLHAIVQVCVTSCDIA